MKKFKKHKIIRNVALSLQIFAIIVLPLVHMTSFKPTYSDYFLPVYSIIGKGSNKSSSSKHKRFR